MESVILEAHSVRSFRRQQKRFEKRQRVQENRRKKYGQPRSQQVAVNPMGECEMCGKLAFKSRKAAKRFAKKTFPGEKHLNAYVCMSRSKVWHFGHLPVEVVEGFQSRQTLQELSSLTSQLPRHHIRWLVAS